jgi:hypothetical protein
MKDNVIDMGAKLLATENIRVERATVQTASFNIETRTLTLPQWREMSPAISQMMVIHEVSHALYTTNDYIDALTTKLTFKGAKDYLNILEDARGEKLIKRQYPGTKKYFFKGYKELYELDFFGTQGTNLATLHLMDRINLHFKLGFTVNIAFSDEEMSFVDRAARLETIAETVQLAQDLYDFIKDHPTPPPEQEESQPESQKSPQSSEDKEDNADHSFKDFASSSSVEENESENGEEGETSEDEGEGESESDSTDGEKTKEASAGNGAPSPEASGETLPTTNRSFENNIRDLAQTATEYRYYNVVLYKRPRIFGYKKVMKGCAPLYAATIKAANEHKRTVYNTVDYMVKEFDMRKAATDYKRVQTSKVGQLDNRKIWSYKLKEDIFKRITTTQDGKNHGMIFLLDWSGSMSSVINNTIDQVISLAMFCQRVNIPFQVFAFTNRRLEDDYNSQSNKPLHIDITNRSMTLLELFSNRMSSSDFTRMIALLKSGHMRQSYPLQGTPLNEALIYLYDYIGEFKKANNVEKMSLITLTDGSGSQLPGIEDYNYKNKKNPDDSARAVENYLIEPVSKQNIKITSDYASHTPAILSMIKARYNCSITGFYLVASSSNDMNDVIRLYINQASGMIVTSRHTEMLRESFKSQGYYIHVGSGYDELYITPNSKMEVKTPSLVVKEDASARNIASSFSKFMNSNKTARIILSKFIERVA